MTDTTARTRTNHDGHRCPPWCQTDHDAIHGNAGTFAFHGGPATRIEVDGLTSLPDDITVRAFHVGNPGWEPVVSVSALRRGVTDARDNPHVWLPPKDAEQLAAILATIDTWDQFLALVAGIRRAAAQITEASHD